MHNPHRFPLTAMLPYALYWISPEVSTILETIIEQGGFVGNNDGLARRIGATNRHALNRLLRSNGLPPCTKLAAWVRVLFWVSEFETSGLSLTGQALAAGRDPAVYCRTVRRVTGQEWRVVRHRGSSWVFLQLMIQCQRPSALSVATAC